ncbi:MAG: hypothetical protein RIS09_1095 [Actinomycetota bacterium]|jgi:catechol 2,3-dioxygenase-like lactoylglutathione lyase family enzyme
MIGSWHGLVIDCKEPLKLANFYKELLSFMIVQNEADWVVIGDAPDRPGIAFQHIDDFVSPTWPEAGVPTQMHIDIKVDSLEAASKVVLAQGATLESKTSDIFWVFKDPEGHPFCLVKL